MRVLVTLSPRLYREAIASSIRRVRPDAEVRLAPPEDAESELAGFRPHLLVHNDTAPIAEEALEGVPARVEMLYSDSMDARVMAGGWSPGCATYPPKTCSRRRPWRRAWAPGASPGQPGAGRVRGLASPQRPSGAPSPFPALGGKGCCPGRSSDTRGAWFG